MSNFTSHDAAIDAFAEQHGLDKGAMRSLTSFILSNIAKNPELQRIANHGTEAEKAELIRAGVEEWNKASQRFFNELIENRTERAQTMRQAIIEDVYHTIRAKQGS